MLQFHTLMQYRLRTRERHGIFLKLYHTPRGSIQIVHAFNGGTWSCKRVLSVAVLATAT